MEKTIQIAIAGTQFQLTEAAYESLSAYLERLKARFLASEDGTEIIRDIETRIAEKLIDTKHRLISSDDVHAVIAEIGDASSFDEGAADTSTPHESHASTNRKLYRNTDDAIVAGVASGLAAYTGLNTTLVRLAFVFFTIVSGIGIAVYIVLWLLMPEAKTASQKLEMTGVAVTLDSIAKVVKERIEETRERGSLGRIVRFPADIVRTLGRFIVPVISKIIGGILSAGAFFAFIGASVLLGIILFNWNAPWNDIPHKEFISPLLLKSALAIGYVAIIIPLFFVFALGQRFLKGRTLITTIVGFGLMGVWALSIVGGGVLGTKIAGDYYAYTASSPDYAQTVDEHPLEAFTAIDMQGVSVTIRPGETSSVRITGRKMDMNNASTSVKDGVLTISSIEHDGPCIFCNYSTPSITITVPSLSAIKARSSSLSLDGLKVPALSLSTVNANVSGSAVVETLTLDSETSWTGLTLTSKSVTAVAKNARVELDGTTESLTLTAHNSSVDTESLKTTTGSVDAQSSMVHVFVTGAFNVINKRLSDVQNAGTEAGVSETENVTP